MADSITALITSLGLPPEAFIGLVVIAGLIIGAIAVIAIIRPVLDYFPYAYPNARVRARKGRILDEKQISEIIEADDLDEVKNYLRGLPDYAKYIDQYPLEKALDTQLAETYDMMAGMAPDNVKKVFKVLLHRWDVRNIKSIIAAKEAGLSREETENLIVPFGELKDSLDKLLDTKNITEIINSLEGTEYANILDDAMASYEKTGMILPLEAALDKYFLEKLLVAASNPSDESTTVLHSFIGTQIDTTSLSIILRAKAEGLSYEDIEPYIISNGYQLREWKLKDLMDAEDVNGVINSLEGTDYSQISEALPEYAKTGSVSSFEAALDEQVRETAQTSALKIPFGIGPIIGFLNKKEEEIRNLKVITRAKREVGFPNSKIKELLV